MKKILCGMLACLLLFAAASAEAPSLSEKMFLHAKNALNALADGAYDRVVTSLPFSDVSPSADEWQNFAEGSFSTLSGSAPQEFYAVAYWAGQMWKIAVPLTEPDSGDVEVLVLLSQDGNNFSGYGCALWSDVRDEYQESRYVVWGEEYNGSISVVVESDE